MKKIIQVQGMYQDSRKYYQKGTWIDIRYPYGLVIKARVMLANGETRLTRRIGKSLGPNLVITSVNWDKTTIPGVISIRTIDGEATASRDTGIVMFRKKSNGRNLRDFPEGWYDEAHGPGASPRPEEP